MILKMTFLTDVNVVIKKTCKYFYSPFRTQNKWTQELGIQIDNWWYIWSSPFRATRNTKLQNFQFKLSHRITATNSFLFKCGLKETELCTFCTETKESLLHLFWECTYTKKMVFNSKYLRKLWSEHAVHKCT